MTVKIHTGPAPYLHEWSITDIPATHMWWDIEIHMCGDTLTFVCAKGWNDTELCSYLAALYREQPALLNHIWPYIYGDNNNNNAPNELKKDLTG